VMERDLQKTSWIGGALVIAWLLVQFRGLRPLVLLLLPLATGVLTTLGVVGVLGLELNLVSAFTFAILVGIGVDFGVHLLMHYGDLRREGVPLVDALGQAMLELRGSMAAAAFTTAFAFGMLTFAEFRGLSQLGGIAAVGVLVAVLVYRLLVPPLAIAMDALVAEKRSPVREHAWLRARPPTRRRSVATAIGFFALAVVLSYFAKDASFEYDFRRLNPKEIAHGIESSATMHGASGVPIYVLAHDVTEAASVAREIESDLAQGFTTKERLLSLSLTNFLPPDVDARLVEIRRMRAALDRIWPKLDEEDRARLEEVRELVRRDDPITIELLPEFVRDSFVERDGTPGAFAVVYVRVSGSDAVLMEKLSRIIQRFREAHPGVQIAAPAAVVGEIMPSLRADGPLVVGVTLLGLFVTTLVISRSLRRTILVIAPVLVGSGVAIGLLGLFDVRINFYNMLIIPVAYGIGIDGAIYVAWAMEGPPETREAALRVARRGVIASSMTTLGAFASFVFASNPGLTSLGNAAIIMLGSMLVATTYWLPAVYRAREAAPGGAEPIETSAGTPPPG
ncbi:MAG: MMPL family transporter, partial [Myxococcales bacterium]|nr:MMPL family transporter [Myxococcales bacterium]